jgi:uncharacterized protein YidB (DUF937 family)
MEGMRMGLLDSIAGQVLGSLGNTGGANAAPGGLMDVVGGLLNSQPGGLSGLIASFEQNGLGGIIASWVGTGQNLPISAEQLQAVLGNQQVQAIAQQLGFSPQDVSTHLAQLLPQVVDKLTPGGTVPEGHAIGGLMGALKGLGL